MCLHGLQRLAGPWDELAKKYNAGSQAKVAKVGFGSVLSLIAAYPDLSCIDQVDCTVEEELCSEQGVRGYPKCVMSAAFNSFIRSTHVLDSLKLFKNGQVEQYSGGRDIAALSAFLDKHTNQVRGDSLQLVI